jgi:pilus assembly protein CpaB
MEAVEITVQPARRRRRPPIATRRGIALALAVSSVVAAGLGALLVAIVRDLDVSALLATRLRADRYREIPVLVAPLGPGAILAPADLGSRAFPRYAVPDAVVLDPTALVGRTLVERILPGEPIREERLAPPESAGGIGALVVPGQRAMSLDLEDDDRVSGFVEVGDRVDLLVTLPPDRSGRPAETLTLLEAVRVLAVDERIEETARGEVVHRPRVTVSLTPEAAERVAAVPRREVSLKLTLRGSADGSVVDPAGVRVADLLGDAWQRLTVAEFRERVTDRDVDAWVEMIEGAHTRREPVVDPSRLRDPVLASRSTP